MAKKQFRVPIMVLGKTPYQFSYKAEFQFVEKGATLRRLAEIYEIDSVAEWDNLFNCVKRDRNWRTGKGLDEKLREGCTYCV